MSHPKPPRPPHGDDYLLPGRPGGPGTTNAPPGTVQREPFQKPERSK
jgi:hypothetical protein